MSLSVSERRERNKESVKRYYEKNKGKKREYNKKLGKKYFADAVRKYAHNNKDKIKEKARKAYYKDRTKALVRANTNNRNEKTGICLDCNEKRKTTFHHLSYKPNIFIELCEKCHNKRHGRNYYGR